MTARYTHISDRYPREAITGLAAVLRSCKRVIKTNESQRQIALKVALARCNTSGRYWD